MDLIWTWFTQSIKIELTYIKLLFLQYDKKTLITDRKISFKKIFNKKVKL